MHEKIYYFTRTRQVKEPVRGTKESAGIDFFVPKFDDRFITDIKLKNPNVSSILPGCHSYYIIHEEKKILLGPGERLLIPSGIKLRGHESIAFVAHNKSGVASKKGLDRLAEVVDEDYMGEIHINVVNTSKNIVEICEDEKLIQWLEVVIENSDLQELTEDELFKNFSTERGTGGFGSTNKKSNQ